MKKTTDQKPEFTLDALSEAIRTYSREDVSYLLQKGILKEIPETDKMHYHRQLVSLQSLDIVSTIARQEDHLDPKIFLEQSVSSQWKSFVGQCLTKFHKHFQYDDREVCDTLFTLSLQCGVSSMLNTLLEKGKCKDRYPEIGSCSLEMLKELRKFSPDTIHNDDLVQFYLIAATTQEHEKKLDYLNKKGFDFFVKDSTGKTVIDYLNERITSGRYEKNRHGSLLQVEDKKMYGKLKAMKEEKEHPASSKKLSTKTLACVIASVCVVAALILIAVIPNLKKSSDSNTVTDTETSASNNTADSTEASDTSSESTDTTTYQTDSSLTVANGDKVNIDYVGYVDKTAFDGGDTKGQGTDLTIGSGTYIDDFEEQLIGAHPGDTVTVNVTFPENYGKENLNGKDATFDVTINGIYK